MPPAPPAPPERRATPRLRRWLLRAGLAAAAVAGVAAAAIAVALHELDAPWLKGRIVAAVRAASGLELDYAATRIRPLSGLTLDGLVVRTPPPLREVAPELARIGSIAVEWSLGSLLGKGPRIARVSVADVRVTLATDEHGRRSFDLGPRDAAPRPAPGPAAAPTRLSRLPGELLSSAPPVGRLEVERVALTVVRVAGGRVADRFAIRGLSLHGEAEPLGAAWRLRLAAGVSSAPLALDIARDGDAVKPARARLDAALTAEVSPSSAAAALDLRVHEQTVAPGVAVAELLHAEAAATFDAARGRTEVSVTRLRAADGAARLDAALAIDDAPGAAPLLRSAQGDVDLARLLGLVPAGLVPVALTKGEVRWRAEQLTLGAPFLAGAGSFELDAAVEGLRAAQADGELAAGSVRLTARVTPGPAGRAALRADGLRVAAGPRRIELATIAADLEGSRDAGGTCSGRAALAIPAVDAAAGGKLAVRQARLELRASGLAFSAGEPLPTAGAVAIAGTLASLDAQAPAGRAQVEGARLEARIPLAGRSPLAAQSELSVERLRVVAAEGGPGGAASARPVIDAPARVGLRASAVVLDREEPAASRGVLELTLAAGPAQASVRAAKERDAVALDLRASVPGLASLRPPSAAAQAAPAWARMAFELATEARVERLASPAPQVDQRTTVRLAAPAWAGLSADEATLELRSRGDAEQHRADLDLRLRALRAAGVAAADQHVALSAELDRRRPAAALKLAADGPAVGTLDAAVALDPRRGGGALRCDLDGELERVGTLVRLALAAGGSAAGPLSALQLDRIGVSLHGELLGALVVGPDGTPRAAADPLRTAAPTGTAAVEVAGLAWRTRAQAVTVPSGRWRATVRSAGARRTLESVAELAELHLDAAEHRVDASGLAYRLAATLTGDPATGALDTEHQLDVGSLRQDYVAYPVEGARLTATVRRDRDGAVQVPDVQLDNAAAGTYLAARGVLDLGGARPRLSLEGLLDQDLARAAAASGAFEGKGSVRVDVSVESPDLTVFRTAASLRFDGVDVRRPAAGLALEGLTGEVPVTADVTLRAGRAVLLRQSGVNPYPALRFADQHPLLSHASFISAARLETPFFSAAPVAGNVKVEQNQVSVSQLELGVRGGSVTGACLVDWDGPATTVEARVRATRVMSSRGEPFDGNAAVVVSVADRSIDGRAEILRIGRRHLLDLLDLQDPHRIDAATNRVRRALSLGYPDRVRIAFDHGFARAQITFGGLARLVRLDELRGIPVGPLVEKALAPVSTAEEDAP